MAILRPPPAPPSLAERVAAIRSDLETWIDTRAEIEAAQNPGVPVGVIRNLLTRGSGCSCAAFLELTAKEPGA